jgi:hypothetical protein
MIIWGNCGSGEIPDLTLLPEIRDEPVFDGYLKRSSCSEHEKIFVRKFSMDRHYPLLYVGRYFRSSSFILVAEIRLYPF